MRPGFIQAWFVFAFGVLASCAEAGVFHVSFSDPSRHRKVPAAIYEPAAAEQPPQLVIISAGYGVADTDYSFLAETLCRAGFFVVSIQHHIPSDPPLAQAGDLRTLRLPAWQIGVQNLGFVLAELRRTRPSLDTRHPVLIGHSNGGDISCLFATLHPNELACLITLDHRRMPLPAAANLRCMSIRAAEFAADPGVLPATVQKNASRISVVLLEGTRHMDFTDEGPASTLQTVVQLVTDFIARSAP